MGTRDVVDALIEHQGRLYSEEMGAEIARDAPVQWFHWLIGALLLSARIAAANAVAAGAGLKSEGLHKIDAILAADRETRIRVLNENGYARFDNRGADYIEAAAQLVKERYSGDLRKLCAAGGDRAGILKALQEVKGIGPAGAEIFAREAQLVWAPLYPTLGKPAEAAAAELGLPQDADALADLAGGRARFVRLVAALTRASLDGPAKAVTAAR
ncbi:hypothetical protein P1J78_13925 [Psychromarinibacter sp. C21-152]|uniref:Endonuclease III n=1 Tax=Psychromarinibacter sediminicola TaxID=3033385 RepID=A0AAE3TAP7_9RHOB|nr:hypothetical protein [Psychromarinibacter sediminicola]MDF0601840.1 hypothetical protein [Psychromarinibacter sediminicola]